MTYVWQSFITHASQQGLNSFKFSTEDMTQNVFPTSRNLLDHLIPQAVPASPSCTLTAFAPMVVAVGLMVVGCSVSMVLGSSHLIQHQSLREIGKRQCEDIELKHHVSHPMHTT